MTIKKNILYYLKLKNINISQIDHNVPTDGLKIPNGNPTDSCLAKSSAKAFVNV